MDNHRDDILWQNGPCYVALGQISISTGNKALPVAFCEIDRFCYVVNSFEEAKQKAEEHLAEAHPDFIPAKNANKK